MHFRPSAVWLTVIIALLALAVIFSVVASSTTSGHQIPTPRTLTGVQNSEPPPRSNHPTKSGDSSTPATSAPRSTPNSIPNTLCTSSFSQAQLKAGLPEGRAVHTHVSPFGCVTVYKIKPGDTLFDIANTFTVHGAYLTLYQWNESVVGKDPNLIHPGQIIIVDPTGKVTAPK